MCLPQSKQRAQEKNHRHGILTNCRKNITFLVLLNVYDMVIEEKMNRRIWRFAYSRLAYPVLWAGVHAAALASRNVKEALAGRRDLWRRLEEQLARRDLSKPLIWFHVASAGEFLQAQPVMERCMASGFECAVTFTSVNGMKWVQKTTFSPGQQPVIIEYLPFDSARNMQRLIKMLEPSAIVYIAYDLWPNLIWTANRSGIPQFLVSAAIQPRSRRLSSAAARSFYRTLYDCLDGIFTVTDADRRRFLLTCPDHPAIRVAGDTRFDSVMDRKERISPPKLPACTDGKFILVVGSSIPTDDAHILKPMKEALERFPDLLLVMVPHEPTEAHLGPCESFFEAFPTERFTRLEQAPQHPPRVILVDTIGVLSSLYALGTLAYVGGGFGPRVHNVTEPAVMGLPVIFGPIYDNSPEAVDLLEQGVAFSVENREAFRTRLFAFLEDPEGCRRLGRQAARALAARAGAADRSFEAIRTAVENAGSTASEKARRLNR
jgi:3-deoxy-D-manno-octulosonic-acid transferase